MTLYWVLFKEHLEMFLILLVTDKKKPWHVGVDLFSLSKVANSNVFF